jgi:hypothetical protein
MPCRSEEDFQYHVPFRMILQELCGYRGTPGFITFHQTIFQRKFRPLSAAMMSTPLSGSYCIVSASAQLVYVMGDQILTEDSDFLRNHLLLSDYHGTQHIHVLIPQWCRLSYMWLTFQ